MSIIVVFYFKKMSLFPGIRREATKRTTCILIYIKTDMKHHIQLLLPAINRTTYD